ncbi:hypothetical protein HY379_02360 [Candidatus Saccharibacteria bacterium]|nr:hypothetical protein [Candidatus Saccharibacteria bacterium]
MKVPNGGASLNMCTLRIILTYQGPDAVREVLESSEPPGENLRIHAESCPDCADLVREVFGDEQIQVTHDYLTPKLLDFIRGLEGDTHT